MIGIGVDIVEIARMKPHDDHFVNMILSDQEKKMFANLTSITNKKQFLASRWASKEALFKATNLKKPFNTITIKDNYCKPTCLDYAPWEVLISISDTATYSLAYVMVIDNQ